MLNLRLYISLYTILLTSTTLAQSPKEQLTIANAAKLVSRNFFEEIKFTDKLGYFTIPVIIDSLTYDYIFDTGGYNTVTTQIMENAKLPALMQVEVGSSNKIKSKINLSKIPSLRVGHVIFEDVGVFNFDFTASPVINCYTNGGLIGKSVIEKAVWQIDYRKSVIRVSDQLDRMPNLANGEKIKIELDQTLNPFLKLTINGKQETFLLDLGYGGLLSLTRKTASSVKSKKILTIEGEGKASANGILQETTNVKLVESMRIGNFELYHQPAYYTQSNNYNTLGSALAQYFIITLNFRDKELILTPYPDATNHFETFGFSINTDGKKIYISSLFNNFPAQQMGLALNDELRAVNGIQLSNDSPCDGYFYVNNLLKNEDDVTLIIQRGEVQKEFKLHKQKPFGAIEQQQN